MAETQATLKSKIAVAVNTAVNDPQVPAEPAAAQAIITQLAVLIPQIMSATNNEPWYQSYVTWGALLAILGTILSLFGINFDASKQSMLATLCVPVAGAVVVLFGRWKAKHPIGVTPEPIAGAPIITATTTPTETTITSITTSSK